MKICSANHKINNQDLLLNEPLPVQSYNGNLFPESKTDRIIKINNLDKFTSNLENSKKSIDILRAIYGSERFNIKYKNVNISF